MPCRIPRRGRHLASTLAIYSALLLSAIADPVISEFMASNITTLKDGHGRYEDWIEIWNPDPAPVDLADWRLTDTANNLSKFVFPSKVIPPGGRLVVFASNRTGSTGPATHTDALGYLHTNFALSKGGEYLALIKPDGTKVTEFAPQYTTQIDDVSYGMPATTETITDQTTTVKFQVPTSTVLDTASPNWLASSYNDTSWSSATGSGVGFEAGSPIAVWMFNEPAGSTSAADASGSGLTANLNGSGQTFGTAGNSAITQTSVSFNGSGGLTVPYSAKLNPPSAFTFATWVYPTGGSGYRAIVSSRVGTSGAQRGYILYITPSNTWEFWTGTSAGWQILSGGAVSFNTWTHIAITRDAAGNKRIYVNGVQAATASQGYTPNNNPANGFHLGCGDDTGGNFRFVGRMDDAAFFPSDIGSALVQQHKNGGASSFGTPLYQAHFQTDVQNVMFGMQSGIYTRHSFTIADKARYASLRLRMKYDDAFVAYLNGTEIARRNFTGTRGYNSTADSDRSDTNAIVFEDIDVTAAAQPAMVNGTNTLAIHGFTRSLAHTDFLLAPVFDATLTPAAQTPGYFAAATPGAVNSGTNVSPGPAITDVSHTPQEPTAGAAVTITAIITPRLAPIANAALTYRVMYGSEQTVSMSDAGPVPGATDGSRFFTGTIANAGGATARQMLRYFVSATDSSARTWREPYPVDLDNSDGVSQSPQYFGLVVKDPALTAGMPIMQWFTNDVPNSDTRVGSRASAYYGGRFYDNLYVRQRGGFTSTGSQKFNFNAGHGIYVNATLGTVGEVNLNSAGSDSSYIRMALGFDAYRTAGHPACEAFPIAMYRNGSFQRMGTLIEQLDEDFLSRWGFDKDGALYKFVQRTGETPLAGGDYSNSPALGDTLYGIEKKTRLYETTNDLGAFVTGLNTGTTDSKKAHLFKTLNIPNLVNFMAIRSITAEEDVNRKNFYFYRDSDHSLEWFLFPWDKDFTFGVQYDAAIASNRSNPWQATNTFKHDPAGTKQWNVLFEQAYQSPEIRAMVGRRLRTLMDSMLGASGPIPGNTLLEQRLEAVRARMSPLPPGVSVSGYADRSSFNTWLAQHRTSLFINYGPGSSYGMIPSAAAAPNVVIQSADPNPSAGTQDLEHLLIVNNSADTVDMSGWSLSGGGIHHTFPAGTVLTGTSVSTTLNRAYVCNKRAAWRARDGAPVTAEYVLGNYDGQLSARGGTVELRDVAGAIISSYTLPVAPTAGQQQLRITELMFAPSTPTASELTVLPTADAEDFEFIELQNIGTTTLDLSGFRFTDGVDFTFPAGTSLAAGTRIIVAASPAAFDVRYGAGKNRVGPYTGALDNSGERVRLVDNVGEEILDFTYNPTWFPPADGGGRSLVVRNPVPNYTTYDLPTHWALSGTTNGTPGGSDTDFADVYEGWRWDYFTASEMPTFALPNQAAALTQDPDGDGINNLAEYAFGRAAKSSDNTPVVTATLVNDAGANYLAATFHRRHKALDLTYTVETTDNFTGPWISTSIQVGTTIDVGNGMEQVTFRDTVPQGSTPRFIRVRAVKP